MCIIHWLYIVRKYFFCRVKDIYDKLLSLFNVKKEEVDEIVQTTFNSDPSVMENADISIPEIANGNKVVG